MTDVADRGDVHALDAATTRVRAANPSAMTLTGTNTYVIGDAVAGDVVVVDPGPALTTHRRAIERVVANRAARIVAVLVTHHHGDHAEAAVDWAARWSVRVHAFDPRRVTGATPLADGDRIAAGGLTLVAHHHPGHTDDHVCLEVPDTGVVLTGDHVLGAGTTVIAWPDGDLGAYLGSLQALRDLAPSALYPGHGDVIDEPVQRIDALRTHREARTAQILKALAGGPRTVEQIVVDVYPDLHGVLRRAAARSVRAHLADLQRRGRTARHGERWHAG